MAGHHDHHRFVFDTGIEQQITFGEQVFRNRILAGFRCHADFFAATHHELHVNVFTVNFRAGFRKRLGCDIDDLHIDITPLQIVVTGGQGLEIRVPQVLERGFEGLGKPGKAGFQIFDIAEKS